MTYGYSGNQKCAAINSMTGHGGFFKDANVGLKNHGRRDGGTGDCDVDGGRRRPLGLGNTGGVYDEQTGRNAARLSGQPRIPRQTVEPDAPDIQGYKVYMKRYEAGFDIERKAAEAVRL